MNKTGIYLQSDFRDYYDEELHDPTATKVFKRLSKSGMSRPEMLKYMDKVGLNTVPHGIVKNLYKKYYKNNKKISKKRNIIKNMLRLVVYVDENAHRGEGKEFLHYEEAFEKYPNHYASVYMTTFNPTKSSFRHLQIGKKSYLLRYSSQDKWRSNFGDKVSIFLWKENNDKRYFFEKIKYPLFALDFVQIRDKYYYMDFNISPQCPDKIKNFGNILKNNYKGDEYFKDYLSAKDAAESLKEAIYHFNSDNFPAKEKNKL